MYPLILIPMENSPADQTIIDHIQPLAKQFGSKLLLVHVADGFAARNQEQLNLEDSEEMKKDRAYLEQRRAELAAAGFDVRVHLACGDPAEQVLALAKQEQCNLIAMATHGHGFVKDIMLGSVANGIRHRTNIPVLMVRAPAH